MLRLSGRTRRREEGPPGRRLDLYAEEPHPPQRLRPFGDLLPPKRRTLTVVKTQAYEDVARRRCRANVEKESHRRRLQPDRRPTM